MFSIHNAEGNNNDEQALGFSLHSVMDLRALYCSEGFLQVVKIPFLFPKWPPFPEGHELQLYSFIAPSPVIRRFTTLLSMLCCQLYACAFTYKWEVYQNECLRIGWSIRYFIKEISQVSNCLITSHPLLVLVHCNTITRARGLYIYIDMGLYCWLYTVSKV